MSVYDAEYFFLRLPKGDERLPFLVPDEATADRRFRRVRQAPGTPPLVFHNGWRDEVKRRGVRTVVPDVMFSGADMVISADIKEELTRFRPSHVAPHPAVYVDDNDVRHDGYWFLTFLKNWIVGTERRLVLNRMLIPSESAAPRFIRSMNTGSMAQFSTGFLLSSGFCSKWEAH